ncbi:hypothetical protein CCONF_09970 [Corynebacterium confusum]|nr:hypothetical protein CCONF_09970 [Corynebacterium confusum]
MPKMAPKSSPVQHVMGRLIAQRRWHPDTDTTELEQDLAACRISEYARKIMADAPALTQSHIDDIAAILSKAGA